MLFVPLSPNFVNRDDRGELVQLFREGYAQVNYIVTKGGVKRGGHHHEHNDEFFYVISGEFELTLKKDDVVEKHHMRAGDCFLIKQDISHDFDFLTDTQLISAYSNGVELKNGEMDIIRD